MEKLTFIKSTDCKVVNLPFNPFDWIEIDSPEPALIEIAEQFDLKIISYRFDASLAGTTWHDTLLVDFVGTIENCLEIVSFFDFAGTLDCTFVYNAFTQTLEANYNNPEINTDPPDRSGLTVEQTELVNIAENYKSKNSCNFGIL